MKIIKGKLDLQEIESVYHRQTIQSQGNLYVCEILPIEFGTGYPDLSGQVMTIEKQL